MSCFSFPLRGNLQPTQNALRDVGQLDLMVEFVLRGGFFTKDAMAAFAVSKGIPHNGGPVSVHFVAGQPFLRDGHHRAVACWVAGREYLRGDEYAVREFRHASDYTRANPDAGWLTPFDPVKECRLAEFHGFKQRIAELRGRGVPPEELLAAIDAERHLYCEPRSCWSVASLARLTRS